MDTLENTRKSKNSMQSGNNGKSKNISKSGKFKNILKSGNTGKSGNIRISGNTGKSGNTYEISHLVDFWSCSIFNLPGRNINEKKKKKNSLTSITTIIMSKKKNHYFRYGISSRKGWPKQNSNERHSNQTFKLGFC